MGRMSLDIDGVSGESFNLEEHLINKRKRVVYGYDGHLDYFFIEIYNCSLRPSAEPLWDSTFSVDGDPFTDHKTVDGLFAAVAATKFVLSERTKDLLRGNLEADKASFVDERSPAMRAFHEHMQKILSGK